MFDKNLFYERYRIKSARLPGWDYSWPGYYYVTICTHCMIESLGYVYRSKMILSDAGKIAKKCWLNLPNHYLYRLDKYIIMPNHVHGIIVIKNNNNVETAHELSLRKKRSHELSLRKKRNRLKNDNVSRSQMQLPKMICRFKMQSAKKINILKETQGRQFWQPRFYDHIVRNDKDLNRIRQYIHDNPNQWQYDLNHPNLKKQSRN